MSKKRSAIDKAYDSMLARAFDPHAKAKAEAEIQQLKQKLEAGNKAIDEMHSASIDNVKALMKGLNIQESQDSNGRITYTGSATDLLIHGAYKQHLEAMQARNGGRGMNK